MTPIPDRRQQPRIPGIVVTQPAALDDAPIHILTPEQLGTPKPAASARTCDQLGVCQGRGDCNCQTTPREAGNVWFAGDEPDDTPSGDDWWPVTGRQLATFWALVAVLGLIIVAMCITAAGVMAGLAPSEIVGTLTAWGAQ